MVEYSVILHRHEGSTRPDVTLFRDEDRDAALRRMQEYCEQYGFTVQDSDGRFTIADILLVEQEPIVGAPVLSKRSYHELFEGWSGKRIATGRAAALAMTEERREGLERE